MRSGNSLIYAIAGLLLAWSMAGHVVADEPIRALILTGRNNHDWKATTPVLRKILERSGRFRVDVREHPEKLDAKTLEAYDVLVSNWNNWGADESSETWPEATREAYLDFVRSGGGHVVVHAGSSSFYDWPEYQKLCLAAWGIGRTEHGPNHDFNVRIDAKDHPVTAGMGPFATLDELWLRVPIQPDAKVLASAYSSKDQPKGTGNWEPIALAVKYGDGRRFTLLLGHDAQAMANDGFQQLLTRGTEWAATGRVVPAPEAPASEAEQ